MLLRAGGGSDEAVSEAVGAEGGVPGEAVVAVEEDVGESVAGQVDEVEAGCVPVQAGEPGEGGERGPAAVVGAAVVTGCRTGELGEGEPTVPGQVEEPTAAGRSRTGGQRVDGGGRAEQPVATVRPVVPGSVRLGEQPGDAVAVEVGPPAARSRPGWRVSGRRTQRAGLGGDGAFGVREGQRGQLGGDRTVGGGGVAAVGDRGQLGGDPVGPVFEVRGPDEDGLRAEFGDAVEHQDTAAEAGGAHLEARPAGGEGVRSLRPGPDLLRSRGDVVVLAVVEDDFEAEAVTGAGFRVAVVDALEEAVGGDRPDLRLVRVARQVAAVVGGLLQKPAEDASGVGRVRDAGGRVAAEDAGDVLPGGDPPVGVARGVFSPALDACEEPLSARPVGGDLVRPFRAGRGKGRRDEVLRSRQLEDVVAVQVAGQPLVRGPGHRGHIERPAESEGPVPGSGVVRQRQLWLDAAAARGEGDRHREGSRAGHRAGTELLPHAADRAAGLGEGEGGSGRGGRRGATGNTGGSGHAPILMGDSGRVISPDRGN